MPHQFLSPSFKILIVLSGLSLLVESGSASAPEFSQDSAYAFLKVLAQDIGPRPMGSPAEKAALEFAVAKFKGFGCQESYVMPFYDGAGSHTKSGNAVGVVRGKSKRIIVIGGHIDSAGPEIPGANDDASGAAIVLELARIFGRIEPSSTLVFACWGGEERGLVGSEYFVENFADIDSVVLMLQVDMANGGRNIGPDPNAPGYPSAARWLVEAAYEEYYDVLGFERLRYDLHSMTSNKLFGGIFGSDHVPFIKKGIPAIDFTTDVSDPIHTPQDNLENFDESGLSRSGKLIQRLIMRFEDGIPEGANEEYMLVQIGEKPLFITPLFLRLGALLSIVMGVLALFRLRSQQPQEILPRIKWSALKILVFSLIVQVFFWLPEVILGTIKGVRFPWVNNQTTFYVLAAFSGAVGLWIVLKLTNGWKLTVNSNTLFLRSFIIFVILIALLSLRPPDVALYPAAGLFFISLAVFVRPPWLKAILVLVAPYMLLRLFFNEAIVLIQRNLSNVPDRGILVSLLYNSAFVFIFGLISLPFLYGFAAVYRSSGDDVFWLKRFSRPAGLVIALLGLMATSLYLINQPTYDRTWNMFVRAEQVWETGTDTSVVTMSSPEFLALAGLQINGRDTSLGSRSTSLSITGKPIPPAWWAMKHSDSIRSSDSGGLMLHRTIRFDLLRRPFTIDLSLKTITNSSSDTVENDHRERVMKWYSFPDSNLSVPVSLRVREGERVLQVVELQYDTLFTAVGLTWEHASLRKRLKITSRDTLLIHTGRIL